jgi:hypothetical protein
MDHIGGRDPENARSTMLPRMEMTVPIVSEVIKVVVVTVYEVRSAQFFKYAVHSAQ